MIIHSVIEFLKLLYYCRAQAPSVAAPLNRRSSLNAQARADRKPATSRREAGKAQRREQLIKATIRCIARKGLSGTTMADVTSAAGLSLGIVNLHFQSKDKLLIETLRYVAEEYQQGWDAIVNDSDLDPATKITALIDHDFSPSITQSNKLSVWFAFWGESRSRPTYRKICSEADLQTSASMQRLCEQLGCKSKQQAELIATGYTALADGLWLDILVTPEDMDRDMARSICINYMASFFPDHFRLG
jgi:TetR/AcrR family transcriptional repressor of bet genes